ncbi:MAG: hypothetical protein J6W16_07290 [Methanobrevibacter sp.]|nr:hypothetical protein [Methanobrevibacter sp.]MBP5785368.1 hypothetical protein [Methanobrevibacter sp.]
MKYLNTNYWKKAYLLEFKLNGVLTDAFTFSVPPENEEFSFPQRKSETKTFGGAVVADYGNDIVQINLSGTTINQELKLIYKGSLGSAEMTGEQEAFYLRDLLRKYGTRDNLQNKEVYLYSLNGGGNTSSNPKWWKIYIGQFDISRNKDKPFCYNYKLNAIGAPEVTRKDLKSKTAQILIDGAKSLKDSVMAVTSKMNEWADKFEEFGASFLPDLASYIGTLRQCISAFNFSVSRYADIFSGIISQSTDIAIDSVMLGDKVLYTATRYYPTLVADVWNSCKDLVAVSKSIYNYCANIDETYFSLSSWQSIKELFDDSVSDLDIADVYSTMGHQEVTYANTVASITSKNLNSIGFAVLPGSDGQDDQIVTTYGYKVVSLTDAESSWDQLAYDYYGDSSLSSLIATYNNLPTDQPLKVGQSILIPNLNMAESKTAENEVYNSPDVKDNYGKDLLIEDKDFGVYNGDLAVVDGVDNLEQSLLNRYSTLVGARIRLEVYGIQASIGDALNATSALIQASVHQTTVEDPRVDSVEDILFEGKGDNLMVSVIYIDKNGAKRNFGGII